MNKSSRLKVGIIGGGISGATTALYLAERGVNVELFEKGPSLVNGPPACHLHAGGNLYRELSDEQCLELLKQSIDIYRLYPYAVNLRPTVIAVPESDKGDTVNLLPRLEKLQDYYGKLVAKNPENEVLGKVEDYFKVYTKEAMTELSKRNCPTCPATMDDWMVPVAKALDLSGYKTDFIMVQEYGLSMFRAAAMLTVALTSLKLCKLHFNTTVSGLKQQPDGSWELTSGSALYKVDYLINACGYKTGTVDDLAGFKRQRMVEFKSAYIAHWREVNGVWPEIIFHGVRGTADGMGSLTPYSGGYFQLHGMTEGITLFKEGLVSSCARSSQPALSADFESKLTEGWRRAEADRRTGNAIRHIARLVPAFASATVGGAPMCGAQQIPGQDPSLRVADVSFEGDRYARTEIVKWSSCLTVAEKIYNRLPLVDGAGAYCYKYSKVIEGISETTVLAAAEQIALERGYPLSLARNYDAWNH